MSTAYASEQSTHRGPRFARPSARPIPSPPPERSSEREAIDRAIVLYAAARVVFGLAFVAAPRLTGRAWIGPRGGAAGTAVLVRGLGARDVALGAGALVALRRRRPAGGWVLCGGLAGVTDVAATLAARRSIPRATERIALAVSLGDAMLGALLALIAE